MTLEKYLDSREVWQNNTIEEIKKKVLVSNVFQNNTGKGEKLVAIYGPPQIGKTTLILCLLGISPEYQKKVYNDIRAGVPKGNSSTSTAIIYQQINSDCYGIKFGENERNVELCTADELKKKIIEIRKKVENDLASKDILHIYIPQKYFRKKGASEVGLNIVDLPGDGSRNIREKSHVDAMINKYMALANVNIIACKANEIQSLETLQLPTNVDWKNLPHKYIVVITNSFGLGTIRKYFKTDKLKRKKDFLQFVKDSYKDDINDIIGKTSQIESFPIDIGDSYEKVLYSCGLDEYDQNQVRCASESILEAIRKSIQMRQGNNLKSAILDLKSYTNEYATDKCDELTDEFKILSYEKEKLQADIEKKENRISVCNDKIDEFKPYSDQYEKMEKYVINVNKFKILAPIKEEISKYTTRKGKVSDSNHSLIEKIGDHLTNFIEKTYEDYEMVCNDASDLYEKINLDIGFETAFDSLYKGGLFHKAPKQEEFLNSLSDSLDIFCDRIKSEMSEQLKSQKQALKKNMEEYSRYKQLKVRSERDIDKHKRRIKEIEGNIEKIQNDIESITARQEADKKLIDDYLLIAGKQYMKYRESLEKKLDSREVSTEEKGILIIYLCLIEKDYQSILEMG